MPQFLRQRAPQTDNLTKIAEAVEKNMLAPSPGLGPFLRFERIQNQPKVDQT